MPPIGMPPDKKTQLISDRPQIRNRYLIPTIEKVEQTTATKTICVSNFVRQPCGANVLELSFARYKKV